jgi:hypothetical protein
MDVIEKLINEIKADPRIKKAKFKSSFLNNIAEIFEKYGYGTTKMVLLEKAERGELQAKPLLLVLEKLNACEEIRRRRSIGRYVIKTLNAIKFSKEV